MTPFHPPSPVKYALSVLQTPSHHPSYTLCGQSLGSHVMHRHSYVISVSPRNTSPSPMTVPPPSPFSPPIRPLSLKPPGSYKRISSPPTPNSLALHWPAPSLVGPPSCSAHHDRHPSHHRRRLTLTLSLPHKANETRRDRTIRVRLANTLLHPYLSLSQPFLRLHRPAPRRGQNTKNRTRCQKRKIKSNHIKEKRGHAPS